MLEKLRRGIGEIRNRITSNVLVLNEPERGIEFEFVFGGEYPTEEWERVFGDLKKKSPDKFKLLGEIIREANSRTQEERVEFVDINTAPNQELIIEKGIRNRKEALNNYKQFLVNINSMSQSNLENMQKAIDNL